MSKAPRGFKSAAVLMGVSLALAACGSSAKKGAPGSTLPGGSTTTGGSTTAATAATTTAPATKGGTITYALQEEGLSYQNATSDTTNFGNTTAVNLLEPQAYFVDNTLAFVLNKDLLDSATVTSTNPQVVVYKINPKAVWQDGVPIDCKDFYLAWGSENGKAMKPNPDFAPGKKDASGNPVPAKIGDFNPAGTTGYEQISSVACADNNKTVTTTFSTVFADWKSNFSGTTPLLPAHILEQKTGIADITKVDLSTDSPDTQKAGAFWNTGWTNWDPTVALSGAWYKIGSYKKGESLTLVRNEKYWGAPGNADSIVFRTIIDATAEAQALQNGEVQVIQPQADPAVADTLSKAPGVKYSPQAGLTYEHLDMNLKNPIFQDIQVRQAFALCINRTDIVSKLVASVNPSEKPMDQLLLVPQQKGYVPHFATYGTQDLAKSAALLDAAGWKLGADGVRAKGATKLAFRISHKVVQRRSDTVSLVAASCAKVGMKITDDSDKVFNSSRLPKGDYDVALFAWVGQPTFSSSESIYTPGGGQNYQSYNNPAVKDLYTKSDAEFDDAKRLDLVNQTDQVIMNDLVSIPLFQLPDMLAYSDKVSNVTWNGPQGPTWDANLWVLNG